MLQAYLAGAPVPPFADDRPFYERKEPKKGKAQAGSSVELDVAPHLESALLQLIQDPSLADPPEANSQLPPPVQGPPFGTPCDLPEVDTCETEDLTFSCILNCHLRSSGQSDHNFWP